MLVASHQGGGPSPPHAANAVVVVFVMEGCGACHEYLPVFQRVAARFPGVRSYVIDAGSEQGSPHADRFGVEATPTTMVLRNPTGAIKTEGMLHEADVHRLFSIAAAQR